MNRRSFLKVLGLGAGVVVSAKALGVRLPEPLPIPPKGVKYDAGKERRIAWLLVSEDGYRVPVYLTDEEMKFQNAND